MILLDPYINFIIDNKLTQEQFLLLHILYEGRKDLILKYKETFPSEDGTMISKYQIADLLRRDFITKTKTGYKVGDKFLKIFIDVDKATEEIFKMYPPFINNKGVNIPLTTMDRRLFGKVYINKILGSYEEHKKVKKDLQYAIDNGLVLMGIEKFLTSEQWKAFRSLREPDTPTSVPHIHTDIDNEFE